MSLSWSGRLNLQISTQSKTSELLSKIAFTSALLRCSTICLRVWKRDTDTVRYCRKYSTVRDMNWLMLLLSRCRSEFKLCWRQKEDGQSIDVVDDAN